MNELDMYKPGDKLHDMIWKNFLWGVIGIILGMCINIFVSLRFVGASTGKYQDTKRVLIQLAMCSVVMAVIHVNVSNHFGWTWQNVTHGLFFVSFFFGVQYSMFTYMQNINSSLVKDLLGK